MLLIPKQSYGLLRNSSSEGILFLAVEWAPYGINVNAIGPGYFPTRLTQYVKDNPDIKRRFIDRILFKRAGDPSRDLAGVLIFLASSASDYVTGQTIVVDGGWTAT